MVYNFKQLTGSLGCTKRGSTMLERSFTMLVPLLICASVCAAAGVAPAATSSGVRVALTEDTSEECTIGVLSGRATADGRPMLFKNRDAGYLDNEIVFFDDGKYRYLALVTAGETNKAWIGLNERGFAVLNALSYNIPDTYSGGITNGALMKLALQTCASAADFESLLVRTNKTGRDNPANLAALDAAGSAVVYEVGNWSFVRYDANGGENRADGFVVRANFSLSADTTGLNTWRYRRALALVRQAAHRGGARPGDLFGVLRDLGAESLDPYPLPYEGKLPDYPDAYGYVTTIETINRRSTVAGGVVCGVLPAEDPRLSTFFAYLGQPVMTPAIPLWVAAGTTPPEMDGPVTASLCDLTRQRGRDCYDSPYSPYLLNTFKLLHEDRRRNDYLVVAEHIEFVLSSQARANLARWRELGVSPSEMAEAERSMCAWAVQEYGGGEGGGHGPLRSSPVLLTCGPNPSTGETGIHYELPQTPPPSWAVEIFDASGRLVTRLRADDPSAVIGAGGHQGLLSWNGRDRRGIPVASGVYFFRPTWPRGFPSGSVTILR
jgi:hypothetical protein